MRKLMQGEAGTAVILVAASILVLAGIAAVALDGGMGYSERRSSQNTADNAALAGAWALCNGADADLAARNSAEREGYTDDSVAVSITGNIVAVELSSEVGTTFGRTQGVTELGVVSDASAECIPGTGGPGLAQVALLSTGPCTLDTNSNMDITGLVYSAGDLDFNSSTTLRGPVHVMGDLSMNSGAHFYDVVRANGEVDMNSGNTFESAIQSGANIEMNSNNHVNGVYATTDLRISSNNVNHAAHSPNAVYGTSLSQNSGNTGWHFAQNPDYPIPAVQPIDAPAPFRITDYAPGGSKAISAEAQGEYHYIDGDLDGNSNVTLPRGLYFVEGDVRYNSHFDASAGVTIVARGSIRFNSSPEMTPYVDGLALYTDSGDDNCNSYGIRANSNAEINGTVYAPHGRIQMNSANDFHDGSVIGYSIEFNSNGVVSGHEIPWTEAQPEVVLQR